MPGCGGNGHGGGGCTSLQQTGRSEAQKVLADDDDTLTPTLILTLAVILIRQALGGDDDACGTYGPSEGIPRHVATERRQGGIHRESSTSSK